MLRQISVKLVMGILVVLAAVLGGCSEGSNTERKARDGRILVQNDLGNEIRTSYLDEELGQVDVMVAPGETEEATGRSLEGGTTVNLTVTVPGQAWLPLEVDVEIDGNVTMRIYTATAWGSGQLQYEMR